MRPKTQLHSRSRTRGTATNKDTNNRSLQDDRIERDLEKSKSRRPTRPLSLAQIGLRADPESC